MLTTHNAPNTLSVNEPRRSNPRLMRWSQACNQNEMSEASRAVSRTDEAYRTFEPTLQAS